MQATIKLLDAAIQRGWANTAHLSEIRDCMLQESNLEIDKLEHQLALLETKVSVIQETCDSAYTQRNSLAVALAKVTLLHGGTAGRGFDYSPAKNWDPEWLHVVYVDVPGVGQVSWHMGPKDLQRLESLPAYTGKWDGTCLGKDPAWPDAIATRSAVQGAGNE